MPELIDVVFRSGGKLYSFDPAGIELEPGDSVIVRTSRGVEMGRVVAPKREVPDTEVTQPLEKVLRKTTAADLENIERNEKLAARVSQVCEEKVQEYGLDMRLIDTEVVFDASKIVISFFAEDRVDFRRLVEDLARKFRTRIEFRQVGVRDEARLIGGYGPCGRRMCCTMFAGDQQPVSIRMAKEQNLPLNPMKISGICGRLMCCLKYEHEMYREFKAKAPSRGTCVSCKCGDGTIVDFSVPKGKVIVDLGEGKQCEATLEELQKPGSRPQARPPELDEAGVPAEEKPKPPRRPSGRGRRPQGKQSAQSKQPGRPQGKPQDKPQGKPSGDGGGQGSGGNGGGGGGRRRRKR